MGICPNDCSVCREMRAPCIYKVPSEECSVCQKKVFLQDMYVYIDKTTGIEREMCVDCFDKFESKNMRQKHEKA